jgi:hypothetical protein
MQNENSASLRAGSTKTKNAAKPGFGSNVRYFFRPIIKQERIW